MKKLSGARITIFSILLLAVCAGVVILANRPPEQLELQRLMELEKKAAFRHENRRGLSPCDPDSSEMTAGLWSYGNRIGQPEPELVALIAPTFSELRLLVFRRGTIEAFRIPGKTGFSFPAADWLEPAPDAITRLTLSPANHRQVSMAVLRHVRYPMTVRQYGHDGVTYYLVDSRQNCAMAWTPSGTGPAQAIAKILQEGSSPQPNEAELVRLAQVIDAADTSY